MAKDVHVVLGMHKSGTTLVAKMLHRSGIEMDEAIDRDGDYDRGDFYERKDCRALNVELVGHGMPAYRVHPPRQLVLRDDQRERMRALIARLQARDGSWGFKDPRTCLTYPLWEPELPPHKVIAVYRSPAEVWGHLRRHGRSRPYHAWVALRAWCDHNRPLVQILEAGRTDALALSFERLMSDDEEFDRLQRFVGRPLDDVRETQRYRIRERGGVAMATAATLRRLLGRDDATAIFQRLEELRAAQCEQDARKRARSA